eukprot:CAMPEP_0172520086 /NCGR_PEP_ID=MMETSP1066-20121228/291797_1 /TAXON_ID=671091 /ORGANISM="Coscinodiscus wailesii, Strain CCMP2513" /LENGTH=781 /DNA_ID=CAMNT_0013302781 /DNA_START=529 /DNA_END=2874 /DNA_ORIENTATION=-
MKAKLEVDAERKVKEDKVKKQQTRREPTTTVGPIDRNQGPSPSHQALYLLQQQAKAPLSTSPMELANHSQAQQQLPSSLDSLPQSSQGQDAVHHSQEQSQPSQLPVSVAKQQLRIPPQQTAASAAAAAAAAAAMSQLRRQGDKTPPPGPPAPHQISTSAGSSAGTFAGAGVQQVGQKSRSSGNMSVRENKKQASGSSRGNKTSKSKSKKQQLSGVTVSTTPPAAHPTPGSMNTKTLAVMHPAAPANQSYQQVSSGAAAAALRSTPTAATTSTPSMGNAWSLLDEAAARIEAKNALASQRQQQQQTQQITRKDDKPVSRLEAAGAMPPHPSRSMIHSGNSIPGNILSMINEQIQSQQAAATANRAVPTIPKPPQNSAPAPAPVPTQLQALVDNMTSNAQQVSSGTAPNPSVPSLPDDSSTLASPSEIVELDRHTSEVFMCAWNPVHTHLIATGSGDASARIWQMGGTEAASGCASTRLLQHGNPSDRNKDVTTLEWSSDGELLATGSYDGVARVWNRVGVLLHTLRSHNGPIFSLKWNKRGNYLLSGSYDKTTIVWDISTEMGFVKQQFNHHSAPALDVDWKDNTTFASCSTDKTVHICCVGREGPVKSFTGHTDEVNAVKWDPSGTLLASCSDDCTAKVWDVSSSGRDEPLYDFRNHQQEIYTVKWSPTGQGSKSPSKPLMLATASFDGSVRLWNVQNGTCISVLSRHCDSVYSVSFSPSGDYLASGSLAGQLYIWNVSDGRVVKSFRGNGDIFEVAWNVEETRVAACFSSNVVSVIDFKR